MTTSKKWLCIGSLTVAGAISLALSFFGGCGLLWGGFPQKNHSVTFLGILLPYLFALPVSAFAATVWKPASLLLWFMVPIHWLAMFEISIPDFKGGPLALFGLIWSCLYWTKGLLILAALVQFGTGFYELTHDKQWARWAGATSEPAN